MDTEKLNHVTNRRTYFGGCLFTRAKHFSSGTWNAAVNLVSASDVSQYRDNTRDQLQSLGKKAVDLNIPAPGLGQLSALCCSSILQRLTTLPSWWVTTLMTSYHAGRS